MSPNYLPPELAFKAGDKVVCVIGSSCGQLVVGQTYDVVRDTEAGNFHAPEPIAWVNSKSGRPLGVYAWRFAKMEGL